MVKVSNGNFSKSIVSLNSVRCLKTLVLPVGLCRASIERVSFAADALKAAIVDYKLKNGLPTDDISLDKECCHHSCCSCS